MAQIGRGTETIKSDLSNFLYIRNPETGSLNLKGLSTWQIYHHLVTFSDPFHARMSNHHHQHPEPTAPSHDTKHSSTHDTNPLLQHLPPVFAESLPPMPNLPNLPIHVPGLGRGGYLVKGRVMYGLFAAWVRLAVLCYYDDAVFEIVRARNVQGQLRGRDLDDDYSSRKDVEEGVDPGENKDVWRREVDSNEGGDDSVKLVLRWMFEGTPRHKLIYSKVISPLQPPEPTIYEGVFVYTFENESGLVINHCLQSMSPTPWVPAICKWWIARKALRREKKAQTEPDALPQLNLGSGPFGRRRDPDSPAT
ncbi:hypothetical protein HDU98_003852 [Podochytrium sp. JEL0797]|nr:hypothetical protein HDU98_003852 [Podochytrium sp. JEL0797]